MSEVFDPKMYEKALALYGTGNFSSGKNFRYFCIWCTEISTWLSQIGHNINRFEVYRLLCDEDFQKAVQTYCYPVDACGIIRTDYNTLALVCTLSMIKKLELKKCEIDTYPHNFLKVSELCQIWISLRNVDDLKPLREFVQRYLHTTVDGNYCHDYDGPRFSDPTIPEEIVHFCGYLSHLVDENVPFDDEYSLDEFRSGLLGMEHDEVFSADHVSKLIYESVRVVDEYHNSP